MMEVLGRLLLMFCCLLVGAVWGMQTAGGEVRSKADTSVQGYQMQIEAIYQDGVEVSIDGERYFLPLRWQEPNGAGFADDLSTERASLPSSLITFVPISEERPLFGQAEVGSEGEISSSSNLLSRTGNGISQILHHSSEQGLAWFTSFFTSGKKSD